MFPGLKLIFLCKITWRGSLKGPRQVIGLEIKSFIFEKGTGLGIFFKNLGTQI